MLAGSASSTTPASSAGDAAARPKTCSKESHAPCNSTRPNARHLFDLARAANGASTTAPPAPAQNGSARPCSGSSTPSPAPAYVRNGRLDILAANPLGHALYSPVLDDPIRTAEHRPVHLLEPASDRVLPRLGAASPMTRSPSCAPKPAETPTTGASPTSSASCPPAATSSASAGRPTTSSSTAPAPKHSTTPSSATSPWATKHSTCPVTAANASSSTPPSPDPHHKRPSTCSPVGPQLRPDAPSRAAAVPDPGVLVGAPISTGDCRQQRTGGTCPSKARTAPARRYLLRRRKGSGHGNH